jgi:hypothetical protein
MAAYDEKKPQGMSKQHGDNQNNINLLISTFFFDLRQNIGS